MPVFGVIGGSGIYQIPGLEIKESVKIGTPFGEPSDLYRLGAVSGREVAFLPRHGSLHDIPPHRINYRANIWGFRELGVSRILSITAAGGISKEMSPGSIAFLDQVIDFTSGRQATFYDGHEVIHVDFTEPFCPELRHFLADAAAGSNVSVARGGTYLCVNGPRLETAAEIRLFRSVGADVVGMTLMPEASLARELEICFAGISVVTNLAAGITGERLTTTEVVEMMKDSTGKIQAILTFFFGLEFPEPECRCRQALSNARM